jgi:hypothetical protein
VISSVSSHNNEMIDLGVWSFLDREISDGRTPIPRKEVIQPHLPVRLPCYDFTPVTWPTFDSCLSCELAHRLQVFQAPMV